MAVEAVENSVTGFVSMGLGVGGVFGFRAWTGCGWTVDNSGWVGFPQLVRSGVGVVFRRFSRGFFGVVVSGRVSGHCLLFREKIQVGDRRGGSRGPGGGSGWGRAGRTEGGVGAGVCRGDRGGWRASAAAPPMRRMSPWSRDPRPPSSPNQPTRSTPHSLQAKLERLPAHPCLHDRPLPKNRRHCVGDDTTAIRGTGWGRRSGHRALRGGRATGHRG